MAYWFIYFIELLLSSFIIFLFTVVIWIINSFGCEMTEEKRQHKCVFWVCVWYHQEIKWKKRGEDNKERERENDTAQPRKTNKKKIQSNNSNENRELASTVTISQQSRNDFPFPSIKEEILCLFVCKWIHLQKLTLEPYRITGYTKNKRHRGHWISVKQLITNLFDLT